MSLQVHYKLMLVEYCFLTGLLFFSLKLYILYREETQPNNTVSKALLFIARESQMRSSSY